MIRYNKLFELLEQQGKTATNWLRQQGMHPSVVNKLRKNETVTTETIDRLCSLLACQPGDILEHTET
jgi:DNA-binding Xre family transcriptional regulator